ncbi:hypothetical protein GCM10009664_45800 [Kitasatospora gansuensis]
MIRTPSLRRSAGSPSNVGVAAPFEGTGPQEGAPGSGSADTTPPPLPGPAASDPHAVSTKAPARATGRAHQELRIHRVDQPWPLTGYDPGHTSRNIPVTASALVRHERRQPGQG